MAKIKPFRLAGAAALRAGVTRYERTADLDLLDVLDRVYVENVQIVQFVQTVQVVHRRVVQSFFSRVQP